MFFAILTFLTASTPDNVINEHFMKQAGKLFDDNRLERISILKRIRAKKSNENEFSDFSGIFLIFQ